MTVLHLGKFHGLGNDFLVALATRNPGLSPGPDLARNLCDRRRGVGADGLIFGLPAEGDADARMVLLNSDGSEAEISGNGVRCLAQALLQDTVGFSGGTSASRASEPAPVEVSQRALLIETAAGTRDLRVIGGDPRGTVDIEVDMGAVGAGPPLTAEAAAYPASRAATVDIGNPHLVLLVHDPVSVPLDVVGPRLEAGYPEGINVEFVRVHSPDRMELTVWERGAGITQACGSGASAAVAVARSWGELGDVVDVDMPGGSARVRLDGDRVFLSGPSTFVAEVMVP